MPRHITDRIILREKMRVQIHLLEELTRIPTSKDCVLYGGSALHGVYLRERFSEDIDLLVPPDIAPDFRELIAAHGLILEDWGCRFPVYVRPGMFGGRVKIEVDAVACWESADCVAAETRRFGYRAGHTIKVRVPSLAYLLAKKLDCVSRRNYCMDFLDLWLGFRRNPQNVRDAFAAHEKGRPGLIFEPEQARANWESLREEWPEKLAAALPRVPDYDAVGRDLQEWFREFSE
jgi:hypothetical protein